MMQSFKRLKLLPSEVLYHQAKSGRNMSESMDIYIYITNKRTDVQKSPIFWNITPRSPLKVNRNFGGTRRLHLRSRIWRKINQRGNVTNDSTLAYCSAYSSTLKMEALPITVAALSKA
jgi:hypothetical protein